MQEQGLKKEVGMQDSLEKGPELKEEVDSPMKEQGLQEEVDMQDSLEKGPELNEEVDCVDGEERVPEVELQEIGNDVDEAIDAQHVVHVRSTALAGTCMWGGRQRRRDAALKPVLSFSCSFAAVMLAVHRRVGVDLLRLAGEGRTAK
eukprot:1739525-Amphidinium_carterae.1